MEFTPSEVRVYYESRVPSLHFNSGREWRGICPVHQGTRDSFAVNAESGMAKCHSQCGRGWDIVGLEQELSGQEFVKAKASVFALLCRPDIPWGERDVEATYDYTDSSGKLLYQVVRRHGKKFSQRRPDGCGGWVYGIKGIERVPFMLPKIAASQFVAITEGEKDALALARLGIAATCNNGGAGNFEPVLAQHFAGKQVAIFPDSDQPGRDHALKVAALLNPVAASVRIVELPGLPEKGDVSDFIATGGTIEQIRERYKAAQNWAPEWQFTEDVPSENDRHIHSFGDEMKRAGGPVSFWDLTRLAGISTPWKKLTRALGGGMRDGEVYVLGANQGSGKTSLALQFAMHSLRERCGVLLFSMEMDAKAVFQRMASIGAEVSLLELREAQLAWKLSKSLEDSEKAHAMLKALEAPTVELSGAPLLVCTKTAVTPDFIVGETERLRKRQKISLVIVDHMQLMASTGKEKSDYEKFTAISREMKRVAVDVAAPLLLVSQTSRRNASEHRGELEVSDLRGSGAIEEDAAGVMLLYEDQDDRQRALNEQTYPTGPVKSWLKLGKNRYGMQGIYLEMQHWKAFTKFKQADA